MLQTLGVLVQIWLVGSVVTLFIILLFDAYYRYHDRPSSKKTLTTPLRLPSGTLWKPK